MLWRSRSVVMRGRQFAEHSITLYMHLPKTAGSPLAHCIYRVGSDVSLQRGTEEPDRFYHQGIYHYPIGFFKDPEGFFPATPGSDWNVKTCAPSLGTFPTGCISI
jgi:hypothetical protein